MKWPEPKIWKKGVVCGEIKVMVPQKKNIPRWVLGKEKLNIAQV